MREYTGAESIDYVINKFKSNPSLLSQTKQMMQQTSSTIYIQSQSTTNFCHRFKLPMNLPQKLLKIFGVQDTKLQADFTKLGYHTNRMYTDMYYQPLMVMYLTGVYLKDDMLKKLSLFFVLIKLWNGMQYKFFKMACLDEVANYVVRAKLKNSAIFKKKTPLQAIAYFIDTLDKKYEPYILKDPKTGTLQIFMQAWGRLFQVFNSVAQYYYQAHKAGNKDSSIKTTGHDDSGQLTINDAALETTSTLIIDKYKKALSIRKIELPLDEKLFLTKKLTVTIKAVEKVMEYLMKDSHIQQISDQLYYFLTAAKVKSENDLNKLPIIYTVDKVLSKKSDPSVIKLKELIDQSIGEIFGPTFMHQVSLTQRLKIRKLYMYELYFALKSVITKTKQFERTHI